MRKRRWRSSLDKSAHALKTLLEVRFIERMDTIWGEKGVPQTLFRYSLNPQNGFYSSDCVVLATLSFEFLWHQNRMTLQKFLQKALLIEHRIDYSARIFARSFFSDVTKVEIQLWLLMVRSKRIKSIFADKRNSGTGFGAPLHFFN